MWAGKSFDQSYGLLSRKDETRFVWHSEIATPSRSTRNSSRNKVKIQRQERHLLLALVLIRNSRLYLWPAAPHFCRHGTLQAVVGQPLQPFYHLAAVGCTDMLCKWRRGQFWVSAMAAHATAKSADLWCQPFHPVAVLLPIRAVALKAVNNPITDWQATGTKVLGVYKVEKADGGPMQSGR
jgi:hypothetical protein